MDVWLCILLPIKYNFRTVRFNTSHAGENISSVIYIAWFRGMEEGRNVNDDLIES